MNPAEKQFPSSTPRIKKPQPVIGLGLLYLTSTIIISVLINTPVNAALGITWRYLALPEALLVFGYTALSARPGQGEKRRWFAWPLALAIYLLVVITSQNYVVAANSIASGHEEIVLSGPILKKWTRSYKTTGFYIQIQDARSGVKFSLPVSKEEYGAKETGATFSRTYLLGRFGIPYRWTFR